jgi:hypothetical protein
MRACRRRVLLRDGRSAVPDEAGLRAVKRARASALPLLSAGCRRQDRLGGSLDLAEGLGSRKVCHEMPLEHCNATGKLADLCLVEWPSVRPHHLREVFRQSADLLL